MAINKDFSIGLVAGLTLAGRRNYHLNEVILGFLTTMPVITQTINDQPTADLSITVPSASVSTSVA